MRHYEITYIVDPVLSEGDLKDISTSYQELLTGQDCKIVHVDKMGLKQLAYPIKKRTTGVYECIEFASATGDIIDQLELSMRRDERIMRFLTVSLDKFGVKYNDDKRNGLIGKKKQVEAEIEEIKNENSNPAPAASEEE